MNLSQQPKSHDTKAYDEAVSLSELTLKTIDASSFRQSHFNSLTALQKASSGIGAALTVASLLTATPEAAKARDLFQVESTYLGNGEFSYKVVMFPLPKSFGSLYGSELYFPTYPGYEGSSCPTNYIANFSSGIHFQPTSDVWHTNLFTNTFNMSSLAEGFKTETSGNGNSIAFHVFTATGEHFQGFFHVPVLKPCSAEESDGSPTNLVYKYGDASMDVHLVKASVDSTGKAELSVKTPFATQSSVEESTNFLNWAEISATFDIPKGTSNFQLPGDYRTNGNWFFRLKTE